MGFSTTLFCGVDYNRKTYNSLYDVEQDVEEINNIIKMCWQRITGLSLITSPKEFLPADEDGPTDYLQSILREIGELEESLQEAYTEKAYLQLLIDNWAACHKDGKAINPPDSVKWNSAFLCGDYIE